MIPKTFTLVNRKWLVRLVTSKQLQNHLDRYPKDGSEAKYILGLCDPHACRIFINKDTNQTEQERKHTFWHEFMHAMKYANGEEDHDEEVVERLGGFMHQFEDTKKGQL